jgi:Sec7-like guanine-nucleotide exchange factor
MDEMNQNRLEKLDLSLFDLLEKTVLSYQNYLNNRQDIEEAKPDDFLKTCRLHLALIDDKLKSLEKIKKIHKLSDKKSSQGNNFDDTNAAAKNVMRQDQKNDK